MFVDRSVPGGRLSLEYRARRDLPEAKSTKLGLLVDEFRGDLNPEYAGKMAGQATRIEPFTLDGEHAIWVAGAPHFFFYRSPGNPFEERRLRLAQNVLLLEHGRLLVRLEGAFDRARAIELARSLGGLALGPLSSRRLTGQANHRPANSSATRLATIATVVEW